MSKKAANSASVDEKPEDNNVSTGEILFIEYSEMALEKVESDTARMQKELEGLKELNKKMAEEQNLCLQKAALPNFEFAQKLKATLKDLEEQHDGMLCQYTKLLDTQVKLNASYSQHCKNAREIVELQMKMNNDGLANKVADEAVDEIVEKLAKLMVDAVTERASLDADLDHTKEEMEKVHKSALNIIAIEEREQFMLVKALEKVSIKK